MSIELKYFVLKPRAKHRDDAYAKASQDAMRTYAISIRTQDSGLSEYLLSWADREEEKQRTKSRLRKRKKSDEHNS